MTDAAVLTGDLIGSRKAGQLSTNSAIQAIADTATLMNAPFERYRGDGWQVLLLHPALALRFTLLCTARLRSRKLPLSRFAIGIDDIGPVRAPSLASESGTAFVLSGELLDDMPKRAVFGIASLTRKLDEMTLAASRLADQMARKWTPEQAEAMVLALDPAKPPGFSGAW